MRFHCVAFSPITNVQIFWAARCGLFWGHDFQIGRNRTTVRISGMQEEQYEGWFWAISSRQVSGTAARLLLECCRCLKLWHQLRSRPKSLACYSLLGIQANCASETWICLYALYKAAHAAIDDFSFDIFIRVQHCYEICSKACATRQDFSIESTASALMSGDVPDMETIYNFYIRIT